VNDLKDYREKLLIIVRYICSEQMEIVYNNFFKTHEIYFEYFCRYGGIVEFIPCDDVITSFRYKRLVLIMIFSQMELLKSLEPMINF